MARVLIELPGGAGAVLRDDGEVVITSDVTDDRGQLLRDGGYSPVKAWVDAGLCVVGGLLPPGAVTAEILDDRGARIEATIGGGAYAAILDHPIDGHEPVVCCRDDASAPVRRPLPADYPGARVDDAEEPCPACGALDYDEFVPTESWRGGRPGPDHTTIPNPIVVCRTCGHEEPEGTFYCAGISADDTEDEAARDAQLARDRAHARAQRWYSATMILRAVTFPIYGAEPWPAQIGGSGSRRDQLTSLTISHHDSPGADPYAGDLPRLEITTSNDDSQFRDELRAARSTLNSWVMNDGTRSRWPEASNAARTLWLAARHREVRAQVLHATRSEQLITIDGTPQLFLTLTTPGGRWVAIRRHDLLRITIAGHNLDPSTITLEPIADPAARLPGPEPDDP